MASVSDRIRRGKEGGQKFSGLGTPQGYSSRRETTASTAKAETAAPAVSKVQPTETPIAKTEREGTFGEEFARNRAAGAKEFEYKGKKYHTRTKEEEAERVAKTAPKSRPVPKLDVAVRVPETRRQQLQRTSMEVAQRAKKDRAVWAEKAKNPPKTR